MDLKKIFSFAAKTEGPGRSKASFSLFKDWRKLLKDEDGEGEADELPNAEAELAAHRALLTKVTRRSFVIAGLLFAILVLIPVLQPIYKYEAIRDDKKTKSLVALSMPNLTDQAILSWAATSITEIMTFGFGDFDQRILGQRGKFTSTGWESFAMAIRNREMRENFKKRQLVLTTVPSNSPVIVAKGEGEDGIYQWIVEMPIVMTYATNNNVTERRRGIVRLTIVRVSPKENVFGIGIKGWMLV